MALIMSWDTQTHRVLQGLEEVCSSLQAVSKLCDHEAASPAALQFSKELSGTLSEVTSAIEGVFSMCSVLEDDVDAETRMFSSRAVYTVLLQQCAHFFGEVSKSSTIAGNRFKLEKMSAKSGTSKAAPKVAPPPPKVAPPPPSASVDPSEDDSEAEEDIAPKKPSPPPTPTQAMPTPIPKKEKPMKRSGNASASTTPSHVHFLVVGNGSIERALGPLVLTARPQNLSSLDTLLIDNNGVMMKPKLSYLLANAGSLEAVATACFNTDAPDADVAQAQNDATLDLLCDAVKSDDIEVTPFFDANGEAPFTLSSLPPVAWRVASTVDEGVSLQTFVCFCEVQGVGRCLLIQDKVSEGDETLHILREKSNSVVEVMCISPTLRGHESIGALYKRFFGTFFTTEDIQEDTDAAMSAMSAASKLREKHVQDRKNHSSSQKAEPVVGASSGGLLGVGKSIVKMPINIGKGVVESIGAVSQDAVFRKNFPELVDEELIAYFNCAWKQDNPILKQGFIYATKHHLCFQGTVLAASFKLQYDEISSLTKKKSIGVLNNSIQIDTVDDDIYFLTSFISRDDAYKALHAAWTKSER